MRRRVSRRSAMKAIGTTVAAIGVSPKSAAQSNTPSISTDDVATLNAIADVVLPRELGVDGRRSTVAGFVRWIRNYKGGAETDHGYGNTRIRRTGASPALASARIDRLPARPNGGHVISDLMAFYFNSPAAADLCYRAAIGRHDCRGLPGSEKPPEPLT